MSGMLKILTAEYLAFSLLSLYMNILRISYLFYCKLCCYKHNALSLQCNFHVKTFSNIFLKNNPKSPFYIIKYISTDHTSLLKEGHINYIVFEHKFPTLCNKHFSSRAKFKYSKVVYYNHLFKYLSDHLFIRPYIFLPRILRIK